jgi:hypothetical protein
VDKQHGAIVSGSMYKKTLIGKKQTLGKRTLIGRNIFKHLRFNDS